MWRLESIGVNLKLGNNMQLPNSLRSWFVAHFIVDMIFAIPMFLAPAWVSDLIGIEGEGVLTIRLVAAALFAIGLTSLLVHRASPEVYRAMLKLKVVWSLLAMIAILITLLSNFAAALVVIFIIFAIFSATWMYYLSRLGR